MSLDKAIKYGKEKRKPYTKAKAVCRSCRNHGDCPWCEGNRLNKQTAMKKIAEKEMMSLHYKEFRLTTMHAFLIWQLCSKSVRP